MEFKFVLANVEFADGYDFTFPGCCPISSAYEVALNSFACHYLPPEYVQGTDPRAYAEISTYKVYLTFDKRQYYLYKVHYGVS